MFILIIYLIYKIIEENIRIAAVQRVINGRKALWANMVPISLTKNMLKPYAPDGKARDSKTWGYFDSHSGNWLDLHESSGAAQSHVRHDTLKLSSSHKYL